jgi:ubiquinone/menaquinone biosynthesis C-methylase UbiE
MKTALPSTLLIGSLYFLGPAVHAQAPAASHGTQHAQHVAGTHQFSVAPDGGAVAVEVSAGDEAGRTKIRAHLKEIAAAFKKGDFSAVTAQGQNPPGMSVLQRLKSEVSWVYTETPTGAVVRAITGNQEAVAAVHAFLDHLQGMHGPAQGKPDAAAAKPADHAAHQHAAPAKGATPDHLAHRFENAADWAKSFDDPARDDWQMPARVIDALQLKPGMTVADIGAGTGYFSLRLAKSPAAPTVYAVDIEKSMLEHIQQRAMHDGVKNVHTVQGAADSSNLSQPVDLVLMVDTYHHIPNRVAYFSALKSKMKPGARLAIVDFRKDSPAGPPVEFRFTPEQISAEIAKAGFVLQTSHDFLPRQLFLVYSIK